MSSGSQPDVGSLLLDLRKRDVNPDFRLVREGLAHRLLTVQDRLSEGFALVVIEGYRPIELQAWYFAEYCRKHRTLQSRLERRRRSDQRESLRVAARHRAATLDRRCD
jgi:hypothetical protein